jgi:hypothetical protein
MRYLRSFARFWIDFIIGDAWEAAVGFGLALAVIAIIQDQFGGDLALSFVLLACVIAVCWFALLRATRVARRRGE